MKKILLLFLFFGYIGFGQTKGISYQALILDPINQELPGVEDNKAPLADKNICLKFAIIDEFNTIEYEEIFTTKTDNYGMVNLIIGTETKTGGYASSFEDIKWSTLPKNLKIDLSVDPSCSNFSEISNAPFTAVPFALFAINSQNMPGTTGAVMLSGDQAVAGIKTFSDPIFGNLTGDVTGNISGNAVTVSNGVYTTSSVTALSDVSTVGSGAIITDAERTKLDGIEAAADVTDATNVAAAGAVMDSEVTDLAGIKAVTVSTLQVKPSEGAFADGDKTKLDGVEAAADVTDATNVAAAGAVMNTGNETIAGVKTFSSTISGSITGNAATATKIASITNSNIVQLTDTQTLTNKTLTSPTITGTGAIAGTFTGDVIGNVTGNLTGDLNGTINTATTATTQTAGDNSTKVATTEFVNTEIAAGTSATVSSVNNHIQSSTNDSNAVTNGTEYSATASIAAGSRTFNSANSVNTFNAGIDLNSNSIVSITLSQAASVTSGPGTYNIQPVVTNINATNNTFTITTYASGSLLAPNTDFTFNFFVIK